MESEKQYIQEVDLKDLLFVILRKWRVILLVAILFAVLLGGGKAFQAYNASRNVEAQMEAAEQYQQELDLYTTAKATSEREIENINEDIQIQQQYMDESVLMNMSPYDVCEAKADLFIKTDYEIMPGMVYQNADYTDSILQAYQSALVSAALQENVARAVSLKPQYLKELVSVTRGSVAMDDTGFNRFTNLLTIKVRYSEKQKAQEILNSILTDVGNLQEQIAGAIGPHAVNVVNQTVGSTVDADLAKLQKETRDQITELQQSLTEKEDALKELKEPQAPVSAKSAVIKNGVKYAILGGVLGVLAVAFCISAVFVMSDKVYAAKDIRGRYDLKLLGVMRSSGEEKKNPIDAWLARLEGRRACADTAQNNALLAANVENYAGDYRKLLITGLAAESQIKEIQEVLQKQMPEYELIAGANMLMNADTLRQLPVCEGVVLVEQTGVSRYSELSQEIKKIKGMEKPVIGFIAYEN